MNGQSAEDQQRQGTACREETHQPGRSLAVLHTTLVKAKAVGFIMIYSYGDVWWRVGRQSHVVNCGGILME